VINKANNFLTWFSLVLIKAVN